MTSDHSSIKQILAGELSISPKQVDAFITLYDDGNTVPFIARYRKEATSGLDWRTIYTTQKVFWPKPTPSL